MAVKTLPITNVYFLSDKITIPKNSVTNNTEKQQEHFTMYSKENVNTSCRHQQGLKTSSKTANG